MCGCGTETLENRREIICINLVKNMIDPIHKLHDLLPSTVNRIRGRETRLNGDRIYTILNVGQKGLKLVQLFLP